MENQPITVRATEVIYYNHLRRRKGDVFVIENEEAFSKRSMIKVSKGTKRVEVSEEEEAPISMSSPRPPATTAGVAEEVFEDPNDEGSDEIDASQGADDITGDVPESEVSQLEQKDVDAHRESCSGDKLAPLTADNSYKDVVAECKSLGISIPKGASKVKLLELINAGG